MSSDYDVVVIGSGPNGMSAAVELARQGRRVVVLEAAGTLGGGTRTEELTLPGVEHDICSAVHPLGAGSPFFRTLPLGEHGLRWVHPEIPLAHPLDDGSAVVLLRSVQDTAESLGKDGVAYRRLLEPLVARCDPLFDDILRPVLRMPRHPFTLARFGVNALQPATMLARRFATDRGKALMAGLAAHSIAPLAAPLTAAIALVLAAAGHAFGWPMAEGGSRSITDALAGHLNHLGGETVTGHRVAELSDLPDADVLVFNLMPGATAAIAGPELPPRKRLALAAWRHGPGSFKVDWVLSAPVPWTAEACRRAGTVHVGGALEHIVASERAMWDGRVHDRPFVLVNQPSLFDPSRAPAGFHVVWGYCHVPSGSTEDHTGRIERQIERFAPGFTDLIVARHAMGPPALEAHNANYVAGDIGGGAFGLGSVLRRPTANPDPYHLGGRVWMASAATPPGAGVHGMAGYHAARSVMRRRSG